MQGLIESLKGFPHRVQIAHAVVDQSQFQINVGTGVRSEVLRDGAGQCCLRDSTNDGVNFLPTLENHQCGDASDAVLTGNVRIFVGVELEDLDLSVKFFGNLVNDGSDHSAGPTPRSPKINEYRHITLEDVLLEGSVSDRSGAGHKAGVDCEECSNEIQALQRSGGRRWNQRRLRKKRESPSSPGRGV